MIETLIVALSSPLAGIVLLILFAGIAFVVKYTANETRLVDIVEHAASGVSLIFILLLTTTFFDLHTTCRVLLDNNLLQLEFAVITMTAIWHMAYRYFFNFDPQRPH